LRPAAGAGAEEKLAGGPARSQIRSVAHDPSRLLILSVHQDFAWFAALLGWSLAVILWRWHPQRRTAWAWLPWPAGAAILTAAIQFGVFNPPFDFFHERLVPGTTFNYRPALIPPGVLGDIVLGAVLGAWLAGWVWTARRDRGHRDSVWPYLGAGALATATHTAHPGISTWMLALAAPAAACAYLSRARSDRFSLTALLLSAFLPVLAPAGLVAFLQGVLPRDATPQPVGFLCAVYLTVVAAIAFAGLIRRPAATAGPGYLAGFWRESWLHLAGAAGWLLAGLAFAYQTGHDNREELLQNRLRTTAARASVFPRALLAPLSQPLALENFEDPDGDGAGRAHAGTLANVAGRRLARQLGQEVMNTPFVDVARIVTIDRGWLVVAATSQANWPAGEVEVIRRATSQDRADFAAGRHLVESSPAHEIGTPYYCRAALRDEQGRMVGWLEFGREEFFQSLERKWRSGPLLVTTLGLVLGASLLLQRRVGREREAALRAAAVAADSNRLKTAFLAKVSHELRTPIQSLLGYSELLRRQADSDPRARAWLNAIQHHGELMIRLVNDLIDLSAVEGGAFRLDLRPASPADLVRGTVDDLRPQAERKLLTLECDIDPAVPAWIQTDPERLRQVVTNLVGNALKFTDRGRVGVRLAAEPADGTCLVSVHDTGPGIPPEAQARLFQAFSRLEATAHKEGSGLGLALSAALCQALGGSLTVASDGRTGSTFTARFPAPPATAPAAAPATAAPAGLAGRRLLVVDDNPLVRELFVTTLAQAGALVREAESSAEALHLAGAHAFDAVVLDLSLGREDGLELAPRLRRLLPHARIVGVSAHAGVIERQQAGAAGMDAFLTKPVTLDRLVAALAAGPASVVSASPMRDDLQTRLEQQFRREVAGKSAELAAAVAATAWERVRTAAHYLANSAAVVRDDALLGACLALVEAAEAADPAALQAGWNECRQHLARWSA